jgi:hypothetical protein
MSVSGQEIFPVFNNRATMTPEACEVDSCNEHDGGGGGQPHLHVRIHMLDPVISTRLDPQRHWMIAAVMRTRQPVVVTVPTPRASHHCAHRCGLHREIDPQWHNWYQKRQLIPEDSEHLEDSGSKMEYPWSKPPNAGRCLNF